ncbi:Mss4-like protein [Lipomyces arxii]|uniref:Mss4-like protein n=1 Tax=Lipomyces arxii TaxID=56418 RepID=UPI0034CE075D
MAAKKNFSSVSTLLREGGKNSYRLYCSYDNCESLVVSPNVAILQRRPVISSQHLQEKLLDSSNGQLELDWSWVLYDPFEFDNIGFSKSSNSGIKYLACADCDRGPLGYHDENYRDADGRKEYLLTASMVKYQI